MARLKANDLRAEVERLRAETADLWNKWSDAEEKRDKAETALGAYARLLVRAGVLRGNSGIGGQTMTGWACAVCRRDQVSPSTAHGVLCDGCRAEVIARAALPAPAEGFFARGEDGQYRLDSAPTAPTEERHWQDDADPNPGRAQAAYQAEVERRKP